MKTTKEILQFVLDYYELKIEDVISKSRKHHLVMARAMYMILAKQNTKATLDAIGERVNRSHSAVHNWNKGELHDQPHYLREFKRINEDFTTNY